MRILELRVCSVDIGSEVRLIVDDVFVSRATLPPDFVELDVNVGLVVGVRFAELPVTAPSDDVQSSSSTLSFRGCLRSVVFNDVDVLTTAADPASRATAVTWNRSATEAREP